MKTVKIKLTGIRPLLMSNPQTVDIENPYSVESRRLNADMKDARRKNNEDRLIELSREQKENDFKSSAYFDDEEQRFFLPDTVLMAALKASATAQKKGKDIDRAALIEETQAWIDDVPRVKDLSAAYANGAFTFAMPAKIPPKKGALIMKVRCMMPTGWSVKFSLTFDENVISEKSIPSIVENAGLMIGLGGWRPKFGRFTADVT